MQQNLSVFQLITRIYGCIKLSTHVQYDICKKWWGSLRHFIQQSLGNNLWQSVHKIKLLPTTFFSRQLFKNIYNSVHRKSYWASKHGLTFILSETSGSGIDWTTYKQSAPRSTQITTTTPHHSIFMGWMLFLTSNQQCQSNKGKAPAWLY